MIRRVKIYNRDNNECIRVTVMYPNNYVPELARVQPQKDGVFGATTYGGE